MNILSTIPKGKYKDLAEVEYLAKRCDGEAGGFWLVNTTKLPVKAGVGDFCYMIFDGYIRGYFDIVKTDLTENCRSFHRIGKRRTTKSLILANYHPIKPIEHKGFQGWRYTTLSPLH